MEEEAFGAAATSASAEDDGIEILQVYSRDINRQMLDTVKNRAASSASSVVDAFAPHTPSPSLEPTASEDEWRSLGKVVWSSISVKGWSADLGLGVDLVVFVGFG
ncbi:MFP1 attachment factor 1-like [Fagus crenata]